MTLEQKEFQYLYEQGEALVFMDQRTYDQIELQKDFVGEDQIRFLHDGMKVTVEFHEERPIGIELPDSVVLEVVETDPTVKGQTASSLLQAGQGLQRHAHHDPALHGRGRADPGFHRNRRIHAPRRLDR